MKKIFLIFVGIFALQTAPASADFGFSQLTAVNLTPCANVDASSLGVCRVVPVPPGSGTCRGLGASLAAQCEVTHPGGMDYSNEFGCSSGWRSISNCAPVQGLDGTYYMPAAFRQLSGTTYRTRNCWVVCVRCDDHLHDSLGINWIEFDDYPWFGEPLPFPCFINNSSNTWNYSEIVSSTIDCQDNEFLNIPGPTLTIEEFFNSFPTCCQPGWGEIPSGDWFVTLPGASPGVQIAQRSEWLCSTGRLLTPNEFVHRCEANWFGTVTAANFNTPGVCRSCPCSGISPAGTEQVTGCTPRCLSDGIDFGGVCCPGGSEDGICLPQTPLLSRTDDLGTYDAQNCFCVESWEI